ncbi:hypothetical protein BWQ96_03262 [Gracilariopsis chorda]|uniref:Prefoldin subunit 1 n=1 Tax=Gracilariopsis chorda TaxID=448386 RepID=A0A2V3IXN6_9FLOR|nr:hypothetical protein BWQ96_03262 [Gracilariopsis chorda]|eukprot:PXF46924.1 hypothetical protein BWQ96_03262 [Gracilariopsis chorda]
MLIDDALRRQQILTELELHKSQSSQLEDRCKKLEEAIEALKNKEDEPILYCFGQPAFLQVSVGKARSLLRQEKSAVWEEVERAQRAIVKLERRLQGISDVQENGK